MPSNVPSQFHADVQGGRLDPRILNCEHRCVGRACSPANSLRAAERTGTRAQKRMVTEDIEPRTKVPRRKSAMVPTKVTRRTGSPGKKGVGAYTENAGKSKTQCVNGKAERSNNQRWPAAKSPREVERKREINRGQTSAGKARRWLTPERLEPRRQTAAF